MNCTLISVLPVPVAPRDHHQRIAIDPSPAHRIKLGHPKRHPLGSRVAGRLDDRERHELDPDLRVDHERELALPVLSAAQLEDLDRAAPILVRIRRRVNDHQPPIVHQPTNVPSKALRVGDQIISALRERHQHARLAELPRAACQELKAKDRLTRPRSPRQQRRATPRQPAQSQRIETWDANLNTPQTTPLSVVRRYRCRGALPRPTALPDHSPNRPPKSRILATSRQFPRSPITLSRGAGDNRTNTGVAMIPSASATSGDSNTSTTSTSQSSPPNRSRTNSSCLRANIDGPLSAATNNRSATPARSGTSSPPLTNAPHNLRSAPTRQPPGRPTRFSDRIAHRDRHPETTLKHEPIRLLTTPTSTELVRPGGRGANVGVQSLWIHNIAIMTGLVTSTTTPPLLKLVASWRLSVDNSATYHLNLNDILDTCGDSARSAAKMSLPCGGGDHAGSTGQPPTRPGLNGR